MSDLLLKKKNYNNNNNNNVKIPVKEEFFIIFITQNFRKQKLLLLVVDYKQRANFPPSNGFEIQHDIFQLIFTTFLKIFNKKGAKMKKVSVRDTITWTKITPPSTIEIIIFLFDVDRFKTLRSKRRTTRRRNQPRTLCCCGVKWKLPDTIMWTSEISPPAGEMGWLLTPSSTNIDLI